jgi:hypothetical protein
LTLFADVCYLLRMANESSFTLIPSDTGSEEIRAELMKEMLAHVRRILACVGACEGLSTEALEAGMLGNLLAHVRNGAQESADLALKALEAP